MPYDWGTHWPGVLERHADRCPFSDGEACTCGPLGYIASIPDPDTGELVSSPLLETAAEARAWRREQEWAVDTRRAASANGHGRASRVPRPAMERERVPRETELVPRDTELVPRETELVPREPRTGRSRAYKPPAPATEDRDIPVSALIDRFLDAAEDGEARAGDGRPYSDEELAELEWALGGYVESHIGHLGAESVRGRHVFRL